MTANSDDFLPEPEAWLWLTALADGCPGYMRSTAAMAVASAAVESGNRTKPFWKMQEHLRGSALGPIALVMFWKFMDRLIGGADGSESWAWQEFRGEELCIACLLAIQAASRR